MTPDRSLHSGERQTAAEYAGIRADHRLRYEWADKLIPAGTKGIDAFCGNGYGSWLLSLSREVTGVDASAEAIAFAEAHYARAGAKFLTATWPFKSAPMSRDFVVSMESIEHVDDGQHFVNELAFSLVPGGHMVFSVPCEDRLPFRYFPNRFHFRHYTLAEALKLAEIAGLEVTDWCGQDAYVVDHDYRKVGQLEPEQMALKPRELGQFVVIAARRV